MDTVTRLRLYVRYYDYIVRYYSYERRAETKSEEQISGEGCQRHSSRRRCWRMMTSERYKEGVKLISRHVMDEQQKQSNQSSCLSSWAEGQKRSISQHLNITRHGRTCQRPMKELGNHPASCPAEILLFRHECAPLMKGPVKGVERWRRRAAAIRGERLPRSFLTGLISPRE